MGPPRPHPPQQKGPGQVSGVRGRHSENAKEQPRSGQVMARRPKVCPTGLAVLAARLNSASCPESQGLRAPKLNGPAGGGFLCGFSERAFPTCSRRRKALPQGPTTPLGRAGAAPRPSTPSVRPGLGEPQSCSRPSSPAPQGSALGRGPDPEARLSWSLQLLKVPGTGGALGPRPVTLQPP